MSQILENGSPYRPNEDDYFTRYLAGKKSADDAAYEAKLQELLQKLYDRQRDEFYKLFDRQQKELLTERGLHPAIDNKHEEAARRQKALFAHERDRYIREYNEAKAIRDDLRKRAEDRALEPDKGRSR